jgi:hypothetical protein
MDPGANRTTFKGRARALPHIAFPVLRRTWSASQSRLPSDFYQLASTAMKKLLLVTVLALSPTLALAEGEGSGRGECDRGGDAYRCFNYTPGNPFYRGPADGVFTGAIGGAPVVGNRAPAARRRAR